MDSPRLGTGAGGHEILEWTVSVREKGKKFSRRRSGEGHAPDRCSSGLVVGLRHRYDPRSRWTDANADGRVCCEVLAAISKPLQVFGTSANEVTRNMQKHMLFVVRGKAGQEHIHQVGEVNPRS